MEEKLKADVVAAIEGLNVNLKSQSDNVKIGWMA